MPLYDAEKLWRSERRQRQAAETSSFILLSVIVALCAGLCGFASPVEHYCLALVALTSVMIAVPRLAGGYKMQGVLAVAEVTLALVYFEIGDLFALVPLAPGLKYWLFGVTALGAAAVWFFFSITCGGKSADADERAEIARFAAGFTCTLLWVIAAHYIPRHY